MRNRLRNLLLIFTNLKFQTLYSTKLTRMPISKEEVVSQMKQVGVVPVFYHPDVDVLMTLVDICYKSGLRVFEFMHQRDNKGPRLFHYIHERIGNYPGVILGAGTVLDGTMCERYIEAGAQFIASPFLRAEMAEICRSKNLLWMPGCTTRADITKAKFLGATAIGILPGNILGPEFIHSVKKDFPDIQFVPSGIEDLHPTALTKWFQAGSLCIKLSGLLFPKNAIAVKDWDLIEKSMIDNLKTIFKTRASTNNVNHY